MSHSGYLDTLFNHNRFYRAVDIISFNILQDVSKLNINCLVATGVSGIVMASAVSYKTFIPLIVVRKGEESHTDYEVEAPYDMKELSVAFIDDQIASGKTIRRVYNSLFVSSPCRGMTPDEEFNCPYKGCFAKVYLYNGYHSEEYSLRNSNEKIIQSIPVYSIPDTFWDD